MHSSDQLDTSIPSTQIKTDANDANFVANGHNNNMLFDAETSPTMVAACLWVLVASCFVLAIENGEFEPPTLDVGASTESAAAVT